MGAPNSLDRNLVDRLTNQSVHFDTITSTGTWHRIVNSALEDCANVLEFIPPIGKHAFAVHKVCEITNTWSDVAFEVRSFRYRPQRLVHARLIALAPLYGWEPLRERPHSLETMHPPYVDSFLLYATDSRAWVKLERCLVKARYGGVEAESFTFQEVADEALPGVVGERPDRWFMIYNAIIRHIDEAAHASQWRANGLKNTLMRLRAKRENFSPEFVPKSR